MSTNCSRTSVHKTSLLYKCRTLRNVHGRNITKVRLFELCAKYVQTVTVQVYTKLVYWLIMKGMYKDRTLRNVHGQNITKVRLFELCAKYVQTVTVQVYTKPVYCTSVSKNCVQTGWHKEKFSFGDTQTHLTLYF